MNPVDSDKANRIYVIIFDHDKILKVTLSPIKREISFSTCDESSPSGNRLNHPLQSG